MPEVDPQALRDIAPRWSADVAAQLSTAITEVAKTELVHSGNFTTVAPVLASVHVVAENFMQRELQTKIEATADFATRLESTAASWEAAETASTVDEGE